LDLFIGFGSVEEALNIDCGGGSGKGDSVVTVSNSPKSSSSSFLEDSASKASNSTSPTGTLVAALSLEVVGFEKEAVLCGPRSGNEPHVLLCLDDAGG
jgi:hypothetical protein